MIGLAWLHEFHFEQVTLCLFNSWTEYCSWITLLNQMKSFGKLHTSPNLSFGVGDRQQTRIELAPRSRTFVPHE